MTDDKQNQPRTPRMMAGASRVLLITFAALLLGGTAIAQQSMDGAYFCTTEFSAGLAYDVNGKRWHSTIFRPDKKFVVRLKFIETTTEKLQVTTGKPFTITFDNYDTTITFAGTSDAQSCRSAGLSVARINEFVRSMRCSTVAEEFIFNAHMNRFLKTYLFGFLDGDDSGNTPSISGGTCTKIQ
jgi:hypothetical protein